MRRAWTAATTTLAGAALAFALIALIQAPARQASASPYAGLVVQSQPTFVPTIVITPGVYQAGGGPFDFAYWAFQRVWDRTDHPVQVQQTTRTWFWGPRPNTAGMMEQYNDAPAGNKLRLVQYFDKSRMELNDPNGDPKLPFFVTNGLLTVELVSGYVQLGQKDFAYFRPACIPMVGDFGDSFAPTYYSFQGVSNTQAGDHPAPNRTGQKATDTIDRLGNVGNDPLKEYFQGIDFVVYDNTHNIPKVFWDFLNSSGPVHDERHNVVQQKLIDPWFFASGRPISEPYWAKATIKGIIADVLVQAYERRVLTYVPSNPAGFQVEMANIGQHYYDWRYRNGGPCPATTPTPTSTSTVTQTRTVTPTRTITRTPTVTRTPTITQTPTITRTPTRTPTPCPRCPSPTPIPNLTGTPRVPPGPIVTPIVPTATPRR